MQHCWPCFVMSPALKGGQSFVFVVGQSTESVPVNRWHYRDVSGPALSHYQP